MSITCSSAAAGTADHPAGIPSSPICSASAIEAAAPAVDQAKQQVSPRGAEGTAGDGRSRGGSASPYAASAAETLENLGGIERLDRCSASAVEKAPPLAEKEQHKANGEGSEEVAVGKEPPLVEEAPQCANAESTGEEVVEKASALMEESSVPAGAVEEAKRVKEAASAEEVAGIAKPTSCSSMVAETALQNLDEGNIEEKAERNIGLAGSGATDSAMLALDEALAAAPEQEVQPIPEAQPVPSLPPRPIQCGEMGQMVCGSCRELLSYPQSATYVQCACCQTVNLVLQAHQAGNVTCGKCSMLLLYPYGAQAVKCSCCHSVTEIGAHNIRPPASVLQSKTLAAVCADQ